MFNKEFYPTPVELAHKMLNKLDWKKVSTILEPSAGKGDIAKVIRRGPRDVQILCIEKEPPLQAILRSEKFRVVDSDFLTYEGNDYFDAIVMNPPFSEGDIHLSKALDVLYSGEIVCLLNAETIRNPYTRTRQSLLERLRALGATFEFLEGAFLGAERKTATDVVIVHVRYYNSIEQELTRELLSSAPKQTPIEVTDESALMTSEVSAQRLVAEYTQLSQLGTHMIATYHAHRGWLSPYMSLNYKDGEPTDSAHNSITDPKLLANYLYGVGANQFMITLRKEFWGKLLNLPEVVSRLTSERRSQFLAEVQAFGYMDFNRTNVKQFMLNVVQGYQQSMNICCEKLFDKVSVTYSTEVESNRYLYNSWKTNEAYAVGRKIILPFKCWCKYLNNWFVDYSYEGTLDDLDRVMNFFDPIPSYEPITKAIRASLKEGKNTGIDSTYFTANVYKKGTVHLTFKNLDALRRWNITVGKLRNWLPRDYGTKPVKDMVPSEQIQVVEFERMGDTRLKGEDLRKRYDTLLGQVGYCSKGTLLLA